MAKTTAPREPHLLPQLAGLIDSPTRARGAGDLSLWGAGMKWVEGLSQLGGVWSKQARREIKQIPLGPSLRKPSLPLAGPAQLPARPVAAAWIWDGAEEQGWRSCGGQGPRDCWRLSPGN